MGYVPKTKTDGVVRLFPAALKRKSATNGYYAVFVQKRKS
jgi:hypothetical protein